MVKREVSAISINDFLKWLKTFIESMAPALAVILWNYQESKIEQAKNETLDAKVKLELERNHVEVDKANANLTDMDVVSNAIKDDGSGPK